MKPLFLSHFVVLVRVSSIALLVGVLGCGSDSSTSTSGGPSDATAPSRDGASGGDATTSPDGAGGTPDAATPGDSGGSDAGGDPFDAAPVACNVDTDCRAFSDHCGGCHCVPLKSGAPNPVCTGEEVTCFIDPCEGKRAACANHVCVVN